MLWSPFLENECKLVYFTKGSFKSLTRSQQFILVIQWVGDFMCVLLGLFGKLDTEIEKIPSTTAEGCPLLC